MMKQRTIRCKRPAMLRSVKVALAAAIIAVICCSSNSLYAQDQAPWQRTTKAVKSPSKLSPREMLSGFIDDSHWDLLLDGRPQVGEEKETLTKLLYRMPEFEPPTWESWCKQDADPAALVASPREQHGKGFIIRGRAKQIEVVDLSPPELIQLYMFHKYYRVTIQVEDSPHPVVVCTRRIPSQWKDAGEIDEPVRVQAIFLKAGEPVEDKTPLYFVAARLGWLPDQPHQKLGTTEDLVWLASRGVDIALWDEVRANNGATVGASESEAFYTVLAALESSTPEQLKSMPSEAFDLPAALTKSDELLGQTFTATGTAHRVQKVIVPEDFRERMGIDHYYQIDLFLPLDKQAIRLMPASGERETPLYTDGFPATFVVAKLPPDLEEGEVRKQVRLRGVFYKLWAYQSDYTKQFHPNMRQPSPLMMGRVPEVVPDPAASEAEKWVPGVIIGVIVAGAGLVWFAAWRAARGDQNFERKVLRKFTRGEAATGKIEPPPGSDSPPVT